MKTLLDKKLTIAVAVILLCIASVKAQIPVQLKKLPALDCVHSCFPLQVNQMHMVS
jgi:hypothetical protein